MRSVAQLEAAPTPLVVIYRAVRTYLIEAWPIPLSYTYFDYFISHSRIDVIPIPDCCDLWTYLSDVSSNSNIVRSSQCFLTPDGF